MKKKRNIVEKNIFIGTYQSNKQLKSEIQTGCLKKIETHVTNSFEECMAQRIS